MPANQRVGNIATGLKRGILVQQVNAQGVMGSGVAKDLRASYPVVYHDYAALLGSPYSQPNAGRDLLGACVWSNITDEFWICSLIGQQFYGREEGHRYTSYDALDIGFAEVAQVASELHLPVHYPLIGCGLGGGDWTIVSAIIEAHLVTIDHTLWNLPKK